MRMQWVSACLVGFLLTIGSLAPGAWAQEDGGGGAESGSADSSLSGLSSDAEGDPTGESDVLEGSKFAGEGPLRLPGLVAGGGFFVLDKEGGSARTYLRLGVRSEFSAVGLQVGLNLHANLDESFNLRKQDWDEPSDWPSFIDYVEYGAPDQWIHARVGRLFNVRLGHGTLLDHYQSAIDADSKKTGAYAALDFGSIGFEALANDIVLYEVLGGRVWIEPLNEKIPLVGLTRFSAQAVIDRTAPDELVFDANGQVALDSDDNLRASEDPLLAVGIGAEIPLLKDPLTITPYLEYNLISGKGSGLHLGAEGLFKIPIFGGVGVIGQAEFRVADNKYLATYFDAQYEVNRFRYFDFKSETTKRAFLDEIGAQNSWLAKAGLKLPFVELSGAFEAFIEDEERNRLVVGAEVLDIPYIRARFLYTRVGVHSTDDAVEFDDQTTLVAQALIKVNEWIYVDLSYERTFRVDRNSSSYVPVDSWVPAVYLGWFF
ncbi:MAG: hypothetical protein ACYTFT_05690 [Planctomycetota bacterium]